MSRKSTQNERIPHNSEKRGRTNPGPDGLELMARRALSHIKRRPRIENAFVLTISANDIKSVPLPGIDVEIEELTAEDEEGIKALVSFDFIVSTELARQHLIEGRRCWVAKHNGQIISCVWVEKEFYDAHLKRNIQLTDDEEYFMGASTLPEYRGKGILTYLGAAVLQVRAQDNPNLHAVILVRTDNKSSLRSVSKQGYRMVGRIGYIDFFGIRFHYLLGRNAFPKITRRIYLQFFG